MKHSQDWSEMLAGYVLGDLSSEEMIQVQRYLADNPDAVTQLEELQNILALLPLGLPDVEPPERLKGQILTAAMAEASPVAKTPEQVEAQALVAAQNVGKDGVGKDGVGKAPDQAVDLAQARSRRLPFFRKHGLPIAGGIAAALVAALGLRTYQLQEQLTATQHQIANLQQTVNGQEQMATLAATQGRTLTMQGSGPVAGAAGKIFVVPQKKQALLVIEHLPPPPTGKIYHLWAVVQGQKVSCVQFVPEANGKVVMEVPVDRWRQATQVGVTLEDEQTNVLPAGEMVMQGQSI
ncbi:anti-sigma factor domain-containing protein [Alkalinema pantanalense CENA528]|uniref:anti-sigma factor domain-containing protein n=1 Tax=Alkalinema pantanalense TaxID=1620705 RepID=UPI003D6FC924